MQRNMRVLKNKVQMAALFENGPDLKEGESYFVLSFKKSYSCENFAKLQKVKRMLDMMHVENKVHIVHKDGSTSMLYNPIAKNTA